MTKHDLVCEFVDNLSDRDFFTFDDLIDWLLEGNYDGYVSDVKDLLESKEYKEAS